jgi:hypothetical protein
LCGHTLHANERALACPCSEESLESVGCASDAVYGNSDAFSELAQGVREKTCVGQVALRLAALLNELNARHTRDVSRMMDGKDGLAAMLVAGRYAMRL